jgi:DNA primase
MSIPRAFIDELIARADVVEIIDSYVSLRKAGKDYQACCPFHQEKTPSFTVSREKQFYYCFGCGATGNVISFLMEHAHLEFIDAVQELASRLGLEVPFTDEPDNDNRQAHKNRLNQLYTLLAEVADFYTQQLQQHPKSIKARDYLLQRGLNLAVQTDYKIGFAPPAWDSVLQHFGTSPDNITLLIESGLLSQNEQGKRYDRFRDRVMFPIMDSRGRVVGFGGRVLGQGDPKYLNSPETPVFHKGQELYGWFRARQQRPATEQALVVEGYMDVVALAQFDINNAVATLGTATSSEHTQQLFRHVNEVIFCFDGDKAGRKAGWRALETVLPQMQSGRQVRFMFLPEGEDPDSLVRTLGREAFLEQLGQAQPLSQFLFAHLSKQTDVSNLDGRARLVD